MTGPKVCSVVFGDKAPLWEQWMLKSLKTIHPDAIYCRSVPDMDGMHSMFGERTYDCTNGYCKARAWIDSVGVGKNYQENFTSPVWVLDVDLLVLKPLIWHPRSEETIMAAVPGGDLKHVEFAKLAGHQMKGETHINGGVIWIYGDILPYWEKWYQRIRRVMEGTSYNISECTLNAIWNDLNDEGKAELLPVEYNQIISEHGPYGARIFHLAGSPEHFRAVLMESYYRQLVAPGG